MESPLRDILANPHPPKMIRATRDKFEEFIKTEMCINDTGE
jgi:hypothetical protein